MRHISRQKLERWLGASEVERISNAMTYPKWYGTGIPVANVPGKCIAQPGGEFTGYIQGGDFMSLFEYQYDRTKAFVHKVQRRLRRRHGVLGTGLASLDDMINEATVGNKMRDFIFQKTGTTGVVNVTNSLWHAAGQPDAGATPSNAPGGDALTDASTGAFAFANPTGGDTQHFVTGWVSSSASVNTLLLYDRIFQVNKTMASTSTEAVTGVPSRYQSATATDPDYAGNNFLFVEVRAALPATAHNWTTCLYTDQSGNASATLPSLTGNSSAIVNRLDHPAGQWFAPLASGDTGIKALTQMQCSASLASGNITFVIGHPLVFMPIPLANLLTLQDGMNSGFNLARIFDDAALAFLEITKSGTTATIYTGMLKTLAG